MKKMQFLVSGGILVLVFYNMFKGDLSPIHIIVHSVIAILLLRQFVLNLIEETKEPTEEIKEYTEEQCFVFINVARILTSLKCEFTAQEVIGYSLKYYNTKSAVLNYLKDNYPQELKKDVIWGI